MRANFSIGEATAEYGEREYLIRPSFSALAGIGDPSEIDYVVRGCLAAYSNLENNLSPTVTQLSCCSTMLAACSELPIEWLGHWRESTINKGKSVWVQSIITINDLVIMANHCVKWGIMGAPKRKPSHLAKEASVGLFDPHEFVAVAMMPHDAGGLGQSRAEAWELTMTEFQRACEARLAAMKGNKPEPMTPEQAKELFRETAERHAKAKRTVVAKPRQKIKGRS